MNNFQDVIHCPQCSSILVVSPEVENSDISPELAPLYCESCKQYFNVKVEIVPK